MRSFSRKLFYLIHVFSACRGAPQFFHNEISTQKPTWTMNWMKPNENSWRIFYFSQPTGWILDIPLTRTKVKLTAREKKNWNCHWMHWLTSARIYPLNKCCAAGRADISTARPTIDSRHCDAFISWNRGAEAVWAPEQMFPDHLYCDNDSLVQICLGSFKFRVV